MMEEYYLDGEQYFYKNGKWYTSSRMIAPQGVVAKLNKLLLEKEDFSKKTIEELINIIDDARKEEVGNYSLAAQALEAAIRKADSKALRTLLPRLCSNYRRQGKYQAAIDVIGNYINEYGAQIISPALYTSYAAAFCDIENYEKAKEYANKAHAMSKGESSPELISVYARIKKFLE